MYTRRLHEIRRTQHQRRVHEAQRRLRAEEERERIQVSVHTIVR